MEALLGYFLNVSTQVLILFILIGVGFVLTKGKVLTNVGAKQMTDLVIYFVTPCVILKAFIGGEVTFSSENVSRLLIAVGAATLAHVISFLIGLIFLAFGKDMRSKIHAATVLMSNCGFMSIPLTQAVLGTEGVFMVTVYVGVFNIVAWTVGLRLLTNEKISLKRVFINPGVIPAVGGILLFLLRVDISPITVVIEPMRHLAALNAPIPMIVIGYYLASSGLKVGKGQGKMFLAIALRLIVSPICTMFILRAMGLTGLALSACVIPASAPVAAIVMMLSAKYSGDAEYASKVVSISHVISVVTMPLVLTLCKYVGG